MIPRSLAPQLHRFLTRFVPAIIALFRETCIRGDGKAVQSANPIRANLPPELRCLARWWMR